MRKRRIMELTGSLVMTVELLKVNFTFLVVTLSVAQFVVAR